MYRIAVSALVLLTAASPAQPAASGLFSRTAGNTRKLYRAATTDTFYPEPADYWTGRVISERLKRGGSTTFRKHSDTLKYYYDEDNYYVWICRGFAKFDVSAIPLPARVESGSFNYYQHSPGSGKSCTAARIVDLDPVAAGAGQLHRAFGPHYAESDSHGAGWVTRELHDRGLNAVNARLHQGWLALGVEYVMIRGGSAYGWNSHAQPYLVLTHSPITRDVGTIVLLGIPADSIPEGTIVTPLGVVRNPGAQTETFPVRCHIGPMHFDTAEVTLGPGEVDTVGFRAWTASSVGLWWASCSTLLDGDENPANDSQRAYVRIYRPAGVDEGLLPGGPPGFEIEPNPTADGGVLLRFGSGLPADAALRVFDACGCERQHIPLPVGDLGSALLDFSHLANGVYLLRLEAGDHKTTQKLVIQR